VVEVVSLIVIKVAVVVEAEAEVEVVVAENIPRKTVNTPTTTLHKNGRNSHMKNVTRVMVCEGGSE
jgi:hypothetical protein